MAIITRAKSTVYGLTTDLAALQAADQAELARAQAAELVLTNNLAQEVLDRIAGDLANSNSVSYEATTARAAELVLTNDLATEAATARAAELVLTNDLATEVAARIAAVSAEEAARIAGDAHLQNQIDNVLSNTDGAALDSLTEIVTAFQNADSNLNGAITTLANTASTALAAEAATARAAELVLTTDLATEAATARAAELALTTNLATEAATARAAELALANDIAAEAAARAAADAVLDSSLKAYADNAATQGGSLPKLESVVVSGNTIVLTKAPKSGIHGIMNFATVRYLDINGVAYDAPVTIDGSDVTGKTFTIAVDTSNQWDGFSVAVQYIYVNV